MPLPIQTQVGPATAADGAIIPARGGRSGEQVVTELHGRYFEQAFRRNLFMAQAIVTAPVIYTTAAGTGGPLLWNGSIGSAGGVNAVLVAVGWGVTTVPTVAAALGITGNTGQTSAPTATTAIDGTRNLFLGGAGSNCTAYRVGTVTNAGNFLLPFADLHTGALTVDVSGMHWVDLGGCVIVPPGAWASVAASATATTTVMTIGLIWEEVPV